MRVPGPAGLAGAWGQREQELRCLTPYFVKVNWEDPHRSLRPLAFEDALRACLLTSWAHVLSPVSIYHQTHLASMPGPVSHTVTATYFREQTWNTTGNRPLTWCNVLFINISRAGTRWREWLCCWIYDLILTFNGANGWRWYCDTMSFAPISPYFVCPPPVVQRHFFKNLLFVPGGPLNMDTV